MKPDAPVTATIRSDATREAVEGVVVVVVGVGELVDSAMVTLGVELLLLCVGKRLQTTKAIQNWKTTCAIK